MYDENGAPNTVYYYNNSTSATKYYYVLNLQGDVTEIRSTSNALVAQYNYDAFGNILSIKDANGNNITSSTHIANVNPLRYRGYFYDPETGFYYLNSRYYDPATRRFISADDPEILAVGQEELMNYNLYSYCGNNPVARIDKDGYFWKSLAEVGKSFFKAAAVVTTVAIVTAAVIGTGGGAAVFIGAGAAAMSATAAAATTVATVGVGAMAVSGAAIAAGTIGSNVNYSTRNNRNNNPNSRGTPRNNQRQNKQFDDVVKKLKLNKSQARRLHDEITGQGFDFQEIYQTALDLFFGGHI